MNSEFEFPEEKLAKLIGIVQSYPCLYDKSNNSYKNSRKRVWVWHKIGHEIDVPGAECSKMWKKLRDKFVRVSKAYEERPMTAFMSGRNHPVWQYYSNLTFLLKHITRTTPKGFFRDPPTLVPSPYQTTFGEATELCDTSNASRNSSDRKRSSSSISEDNEVSEKAIKSEEYCGDDSDEDRQSAQRNLEGYQAWLMNVKQAANILDSDDLFCRSLYNSLQKLTASEKSLVKSEVMRLVLEKEEEIRKTQNEDANFQ